MAEYFPEHRVLWPAAGDTRERPGYLGYVADWRQVIEAGEGGEPDVGEGSAVWNFFASLGFRLGHTMHALEQEQALHARHPQPAPPQYLRESISKWQQAVALLEGDDVDDDEGAAAPTAEALRDIRARIVAELSANETMLAPGRVRHYLDRNGEPRTALVRDFNWDWAGAAVRGGEGQRRRQFWSVDRWPLGTGHLSARAEGAVRADAHADAAAAQDPTDRRYMRAKLRPYGEEEGEGRVLIRPGPAVYPIGDTRRQREAVEEVITAMVHRGE